MCRVGFKLLLFNVTFTLHNHAIVASGMYHTVFIKTENIIVDEIGRSICSYLLAQSRSYIFLNNIIMHA